MMAVEVFICPSVRPRIVCPHCASFRKAPHSLALRENDRPDVLLQISKAELNGGDAGEVFCSTVSQSARCFWRSSRPLKVSLVILTLSGRPTSSDSKLKKRVPADSFLCVYSVLLLCGHRSFSCSCARRQLRGTHGC